MNTYLAGRRVGFFGLGFFLTTILHLCGNYITAEFDSLINISLEMHSAGLTSDLIHAEHFNFEDNS